MALPLKKEKQAPLLQHPNNVLRYSFVFAFTWSLQNVNHDFPGTGKKRKENQGPIFKMKKVYAFKTNQQCNDISLTSVNFGYIN